MKYTNEQILANRKKWIDYLMSDEPVKAKGTLEKTTNKSERCCLGHGCYILKDDLNLKVHTLEHSSYVSYNNETAIAPAAFVKAVGLHNPTGSANFKYFEESNIFFNGMKYVSLASLNDKSTATPQEIGAILKKLINGGDDTPFKRLENE